MKRTLHKHPTLEEYRASPEPELIKQHEQSDTQEPEKRTTSGQRNKSLTAVIVLGLIAVLTIVSVSSWWTHKRKAAEESDIYAESSGSDNDTIVAEKTEEEIKVEKWAEIFDNYTAKTAGKESTIWLLELQELGELLEGEEGILFGESDSYPANCTEELKYAPRIDGVKELDIVVGDTSWIISVMDFSYKREVVVHHDPSGSGETPDIVKSLVNDLFGLDPDKNIPEQMGISEEMLYDGVSAERSYGIDYTILDHVEYNQVPYVVMCEVNNDSGSIGLNMYRRDRHSDSNLVWLDLHWKRRNGNLPHMLCISFDDDLVYSNRS